MELTPDVRRAAIAEVQRYFSEEREEELGELGATLLLDAILDTVGPAVYNQALADAAAWFRTRLESLEVDFFQLEQRPPDRTGRA